MPIVQGRSAMAKSVQPSGGNSKKTYGSRSSVTAPRIPMRRRRRHVNPSSCSIFVTSGLECLTRLLPLDQHPDPAISPGGRRELLLLSFLRFGRLLLGPTLSNGICNPLSCVGTQAATLLRSCRYFGICGLVALQRPQCRNGVGDVGAFLFEPCNYV